MNKCKTCKLSEHCSAVEIIKKCTCYQSKEQTNEEWFCNLTTKEKAKYIAKAMYFYSEKFGLTMLEALNKSIEWEQGLNRTIENDVVEWLKEVHNDG